MINAMKKGLVHIYTGDGKGKTTASLGLAFRGIGCGLRVNMIQFLKTWDTGEVACAKRLSEQFKIWNFESKHGFINEMNEVQKAKLQLEINKAMEFAKECALNGESDILILDEIFGAVSNGMVSTEQILELIILKAENTELVLTGRNAPECIVEAADYVSKIDMIKHPYEQGIGPRKGIEF